MIDFFQTLNIKRFVFSDGDNVNNPKQFIDFIESMNYLNLETQVVCFLGANQNQNIWYNNAVKYIQKLKPGFSYNITPIRIRKEGDNALDMVLATYIGLSIRQNINSEFIIVSADKGYDSIIEHFSTIGINIKKVSIKNEDKVQKDKNPDTVENKLIKRIIEKISEMKDKSKQKMPKTIKAFNNLLLNSFKSDVNDKNLKKISSKIIKELSDKEILSTKNSKIEWL